MKRQTLLLFAIALAPAVASAQGSPVADAFRADEATMAKNLVAAAETMPAADYGYKPTPAQMPFGQVATHLAQGNDLFCGAIGGMKAPMRSNVAPTDSKDVLVARLKETFAFCDQALAKLDDSKLGEDLPMFGGKMTRAAIIIMTAGDWEDHYSQWSNYLRLKGLLPPTAKKP